MRHVSAFHHFINSRRTVSVKISNENPGNVTMINFKITRIHQPTFKPILVMSDFTILNQIYLPKKDIYQFFEGIQRGKDNHLVFKHTNH